MYVYCAKFHFNWNKLSITIQATEVFQVFIPTEAISRLSFHLFNVCVGIQDPFQFTSRSHVIQHCSLNNSGWNRSSVLQYRHTVQQEKNKYQFVKKKVFRYTECDSQHIAGKCQEISSDHKYLNSHRWLLTPQHLVPQQGRPAVRQSGQWALNLLLQAICLKRFPFPLITNERKWKDLCSPKSRDWRKNFQQRRNMSVHRWMIKQKATGRHRSPKDTPDLKPALTHQPNVCAEFPTLFAGARGSPSKPYLHLAGDTESGFQPSVLCSG